MLWWWLARKLWRKMHERDDSLDWESEESEYSLYDDYDVTQDYPEE